MCARLLWAVKVNERIHDIFKKGIPCSFCLLIFLEAKAGTLCEGRSAADTFFNSTSALKPLMLIALDQPV